MEIDPMRRSVESARLRDQWEPYYQELVQNPLNNRFADSMFEVLSDRGEDADMDALKSIALLTYPGSVSARIVAGDSAETDETRELQATRVIDILEATFAGLEISTERPDKNKLVIKDTARKEFMGILETYIWITTKVAE